MFLDVSVLITTLSLILILGILGFLFVGFGFRLVVFFLTVRWGLVVFFGVVFLGLVFALVGGGGFFGFTCSRGLGGSDRRTGCCTGIRRA